MSYKSRHIEVSSVALVDLKAEISRRQIEIKQRLEKHPDGCNVVRKSNSSGFTNKSSLLRLNDQRKQERDAKDLSKLKSEKPSLTNTAEYAEWERSKRSLEAKAKLYDALKSAAGSYKFNQINENDSDILVDFERKARTEKSIKELSPFSVHSSSNLSDDDISDDEGDYGDNEKYNAICSDEEWSSYTDKRGVKRFCMRKDLESFENATPQPNSDDPLTYAHLREGEIRNHGVGFYAFSKDAKSRETEMNRLRELHRATEEGRIRAQVIRAKRDAKMGQRLARLRARKGLPDVATAAAQCLADTPLVPNTPQTPLGVDSQSDIRLSKDDLDVASMLRRLRDEAEKRQASVNTQSEKSSSIIDQGQPGISTEATLADIYKFQTGVSNSGQKNREWDKGKSMMSAQRYTQLEREKRINDFAPPSHY